MDNPVESDRQSDRLEEFPVMFFAVPMGFLGLTLACGAASRALGLGPLAGDVVLGLSAAILLAVSLFYAAKAVRHPHAVKAEWAHPIRIAFFPAASISVLLLAAAALPRLPDFAGYAWIAGVLLQGLLTLAVVATWIGHRAFQPVHMSPAWFIPAVGNVIVPIAGAPLGHVELSWLFFSGGLIFWAILLTLVFNRLVFHDPLPQRLTPTLVILLAPPAVGFVAYLRLTDEIDSFARILLNIGYVFAAVVATQLPKFRRMPFALSWWALSFPLAALSTATLVFAEATESAGHRLLGLVLVGLLVLVIAVLAAFTLRAIARRQICRPE